MHGKHRSTGDCSEPPDCSPTSALEGPWHTTGRSPGRYWMDSASNPPRLSDASTVTTEKESDPSYSSCKDHLFTEVMGELKLGGAWSDYDTALSPPTRIHPMAPMPRCTCGPTSPGHMAPLSPQTFPANNTCSFLKPCAWKPQACMMGHGCP